MSNTVPTSEDENENIKNDSKEAMNEYLGESDMELDKAFHEESIRKNQEEIRKRMYPLNKKFLLGLKEQLSNEKKLWKQEIQEEMRNHFKTHALHFSNEYYTKYRNLREEMISESAHFSYSSRSDEDLLASKFQNELRYQRSRYFNSEMTAIEKKLLEAESMYKTELDKVKQHIAVEMSVASKDMLNKVHPFNS